MEEIIDSMRRNGWDGPPVEVIRIGEFDYVLNGHHRIAAARAEGLKVRIVRINASDLKDFGYENTDDVVSAAAYRRKDELWVK